MADLRDLPVSHPVSRRVERFCGRVISVRTDTVELPGGSRADRDVVAHPGAVGIIALDDTDQVLLVQQYRHPPGRLLWEPPAGILDQPGEPPLATAQRELYEEAGYRADRWAVLVDLLTSPGMSDEALRIYLARGLHPVDATDRFVGEHEEADMPLAWLPLDDAVAGVLAGRLHNPTAVSGLLAAYAARARGFTDLRPADSGWPDRPMIGSARV